MHQKVVIEAFPVIVTFSWSVRWRVYMFYCLSTNLISRTFDMNSWKVDDVELKLENNYLTKAPSHIASFLECIILCLIIFYLSEQINLVTSHDSRQNTVFQWQGSNNMGRLLCRRKRFGTISIICRLLIPFIYGICIVLNENIKIVNCSILRQTNIHLLSYWTM